MNDLDFTFEETPWELTLDTLRRGDKLSAARFLTLMEGEDEMAVEDALLDLEMGGVLLDVSDLPKAAGIGEAAVRLRREEQLVKQPDFIGTLDKSDPLRLYLEELAAIPACGDPAVLVMECLEGKKGAQERLLNVRLHRVVEIARDLVGRGVLLLDRITRAAISNPTATGGSGSPWRRSSPCRPGRTAWVRRCARPWRITGPWTSVC